MGWGYLGHPGEQVNCLGLSAQLGDPGDQGGFFYLNVVAGATLRDQGIYSGWGYLGPSQFGNRRRLGFYGGWDYLGLRPHLGKSLGTEYLCWLGLPGSTSATGKSWGGIYSGWGYLELPAQPGNRGEQE